MLTKKVSTVLSYKDIQNIEKKMVGGIFPTAIKIIMRDGGKFVFTSFMKRDSAFTLICQKIEEVNEVTQGKNCFIFYCLLGYNGYYRL